jgi:hypothetical protein
MGFIFLALLIILVGLLLPIMILIDILRSTFKESDNKLVWIIVVLLVPMLGSVLYLIIGVKQKVQA